MHSQLCRLSAFLALGCAALVSSCNSDRHDGTDPGSGIDRQPPVPENVAMFPSRSGPPAFEIRWVLPEGTAEIVSFTVYESDQEFDVSDQAKVVATTPGTTRSAEVEMRQDTGVRHFRVSALTTDSVEEKLSAELAIDTTARLCFVAGSTPPGLEASRRLSAGRIRRT